MRAGLAYAVVQQSHSVLNPSSPQSRLIDRLWDAMYVTATIVFILVVAALLWGAFHRRVGDPPPTSPARERSLTTAVSIATALTVVVLFAFLVYDVAVGRPLTRNPGKEALQIRVTG